MTHPGDFGGGEAIFPFATLVLVDMRADHLKTSPLPSCIAGSSAAVVSNCREALRFARAAGRPVAFVRGSGKAVGAEGGDWIDGFAPLRLEAVFDRKSPSCYSSLCFADAVSENGGAALIAGFLGAGGMLACGLDAMVAGQRVGFLIDAVCDQHADQAFGADAVRLHQALAKIGVGLTTTFAWMRMAGRLPPFHHGWEGRA